MFSFMLDIRFTHSQSRSQTFLNVRVFEVNIIIFVGYDTITWSALPLKLSVRIRTLIPKFVRLVAPCFFFTFSNGEIYLQMKAFNLIDIQYSIKSMDLGTKQRADVIVVISKNMFAERVAVIELPHITYSIQY